MMNLMEPLPLPQKSQPNKNKQLRIHYYFSLCHFAIGWGEVRLKIEDCVQNERCVFSPNEQMNRRVVFLNFSEVLFSYVSQFLLKELRFQ